MLWLVLLAALPAHPIAAAHPAPALLDVLDAKSSAVARGAGYVLRYEGTLASQLWKPVTGAIVMAAHANDDAELASLPLDRFLADPCAPPKLGTEKVFSRRIGAYVGAHRKTAFTLQRRTLAAPGSPAPELFHLEVLCFEMQDSDARDAFRLLREGRPEGAEGATALAILGLTGSAARKRTSKLRLQSGAAATRATLLAMLDAKSPAVPGRPGLVQLVAIRGLGTLADPTTVHPLLRFAKIEFGESLRMALLAEVEIAVRCKEPRSPLCALIGERIGLRRRAPIDVALRMMGAPAVHALTVIAQSDAALREEALERLRGLVDFASVEELKIALPIAADAGTDEAGRFLADLSRRPELREPAERAMANAGAAACEGITAGLRAPDVEERDAVVRALVAMGPLAVDAVERAWTRSASGANGEAPPAATIHAVARLANAARKPAGTRARMRLANLARAAVESEMEHDVRAMLQSAAVLSKDAPGEAIAELRALPSVRHDLGDALTQGAQLLLAIARDPDAPSLARMDALRLAEQLDPALRGEAAVERRLLARALVPVERLAASLPEDPPLADERALLVHALARDARTRPDPEPLLERLLELAPASPLADRLRRERALREERRSYPFYAAAALAFAMIVAGTLRAAQILRRRRSAR